MSKIESESESDLECTHENTQTEKGATVCTDCGVELNNEITDSKLSFDPSRYYFRSNDERSIYKDVEGLGFSAKVVDLANKLYLQVSQDKIFRGTSRRAIIFACIFYAYKSQGTPQTCDHLLNVFKIQRKAGLRGLKMVNMNAPKDSEIRTTYITPLSLIDETMNKFKATEAQKREVENLYKRIENKSSMLNRSRPQSVGAGLIYYWICQKKKPISSKDFSKEVQLSELTINKIYKEIVRILEPIEE